MVAYGEAWAFLALLHVSGQTAEEGDAPERVDDREQ